MKRIEFSGCDGSGKTSALLAVMAELQNKGYRVLHTREVGNPHIPVCVELRKLILDPANNLSSHSIELICAAMKLENDLFYEKIKNEYDYVLNDRGYLDHLAYCDAQCDPIFTQDLYHACVNKLTSPPDMMLYFKVSPVEATIRRHARNGPVDAIEMKGEEFQKLVSERFDYHAEKCTQVHVIDADKSPTEVVEQVLAYINGN